MKILGLDLAGSEKRKTGVAILNEKLEARSFILFKDKEILDLVEKERPDLICIDAPLSLPKGRKSLKKKSRIHFRKCDRELQRLQIKFFPITLGPMRKLTERGIKLRKILEKKYKVIEVYPGATQDILNIKRKNEGIEKLKKGLEKLKIKILNKNPNGDELDAITAAYTGWLHLRKKTISVGEKREGQIVLPKIPSILVGNCLIDLRKRVFLPRSETKFWIKKALKDCKFQIASYKLKRPKFLDIFAGSGFIGVFILKKIKNSHVDFIDLDRHAIEQIKINLRLNKIPKKRYRVFLSDLFEKIKKNTKYHFIFANPPYVAKERLFEVQDSVKEEPKISWYGGKGGLKYIKKFLSKAKTYLADEGLIFLEIDPFQKKEVEEILRKNKYEKWHFFEDQFGKIRWLKIEK